MHREGIAFARFHPVPLFFYFTAVTLFTAFTQNPVILLLSLLGGALFAVSVSTAGEILADIKFYAVLFLAVALTNPLFAHGGVTPLFFMNDNPVTLEAVMCGVDIAAMITAVMLVCKGFAKVMESDKLLALMGKISPRLATVFCMSLRFIPLLKRKWAQIKEAQSAMGYFRADSIIERLASYARVFSALVSWALENAVDTAASMSARGYGLPGKRSFSLFRFTRADGALLMVTALLCAGTLFGFLSGSADFAFYPVITPIGADASALICYVSFGILAFLPFIFEVKEALKWRYLRSKL